VKKTVLLAALSLLLLAAMIAPVMAGPTDVVVQVGDWFKYERSVTEWDSTDPFLPEGYFGPLSLADNQTNYVLYTVTDITSVTEPAAGKNVTFLVTYNWKNGSETTETMVEHVSTANQNIFMIGANMEAPQMVSDAYLFFGFFDYPARYLNRTFDFVNPSATRATNELNYTIDLFGSLYTYTMWWDQATGMRVYYENHGDVAAFGESAEYSYTVVWKLVDSSIDDLIYVPEMLTTAVMLLILSASTASIVLYRRKRLFRLN
jgi:hypothetical protein